MNIEVCRKCLGGEVYAETAARVFDSCTQTFSNNKLRVIVDLRGAWGNSCVVQVESITMPPRRHFFDNKAFDAIRMDDKSCLHFAEHFIYDCNLKEKE